ncbi:MAG: PKD domain-containing protein, partial [Calditrichaceae bacterium]
SDPAFINNTITGNVANLNVIADEQGGIIYISGSNPLFVNNILWDNTPQDIYIAQNAIAASVMLAYTDIQNGQSAVNYGDNGTLYWQEGNINRDPLFLDASHGNYNLTSGSTCIDSGTAYYEWDSQVLIDLQSDEYVGSAPDMGALEYNSDEKFNQPPSAIIHSNKTEGSAPLTVSFDASASYDNDGNLNSYYWDFDDGGTSTAIKPEHTFSDSGTYYVRLTVTDDDGAYDREVFKIYAHGGTSIPEGSISGVWQISGSPYYIEGDVTVPAGESLTINAGVEIIFKSWYHFMVNGLLQVNGTHDMPVMFKPQDSTLSWRGMRIMNASDDCYLNWCTMEFAHAVGEAPLDRGGALYVNNTDIMIENCTFQKNEADNHGGGLYLENSNVLIDGCIIRDNYSGTGTTCYGGGISCINSNPVIRNSEISNNSVGVSGGFSTGRGSGGGIYLGNSDAVLEYNIISNNRIGGSGNTGSWARGAAIYATSSDPVLINNTITGNVADLNIIADEQGGIMYVSGSNPKFVNNILWNNTPQDIYIVQNAIAASVIVAYTDIQNGQSAVNYGDNGTLYWQEGNIDQNPWFLDASNQDYNLIAGSPCIDKGTAYYEWDDQVLVDLNSGQYNGSAPDMGAVESGTVSGIDDAGYAVNNFEMLQNYPNPFNPTTTIKFTLPKAGWVNIAVFNTLGEKIMTLIDRPMTSGIYQVDFDGTDLSSGIYYYAIKAGDFHQVKKMMLLK